MARTFADETVETSNTTGIGAYALEGPKGDYLPFEASYASGDKPAFVVRNNGNTKWEENRGAAFTPGSPSTLARGVWKSTNGNAPVNWTVDDLPLTVYVPASAEVHEGAITGWMANARHALLRAGGRWWDDTAGLAVSWFDTLVTGPATDSRVGYYDAVKDVYFPDSRRPSVAVGAADKTVFANEIGVCFSYNTTAAARTVTLPLGSTVKDGFTTSHVGLDIANGLIFTPNAADGIESAADGAPLTVPGKVPVSMRWDAARDTWASSYVPTQAPVTAGRRQTVPSGPVSAAGLPTFLPASSVSLNLTTQNLAVTPLVLSAANGWLATNGRPNDRVAVIAANFPWTGLTPSRPAATPNFLYLILNADGTQTASHTILPLIEQEGGVPSITSGQITFNRAEMKCYLGNGASAPQTNLVWVGEAATDGSTVTSTVAYGYNGYYASIFATPLPGAAAYTPAAHNLGVKPRVAKLVIENITTELGFAVGDQVSEGHITAYSTVFVSLPIVSTAKTIGFQTGANAGLVLLERTTGAATALAVAKWQYKFVADRGW